MPTIPVFAAPAAARRGITLMEVLISIGILAVGLTSVVALVPAGRSQASRAIILDRAGTMGANALADAITAGFTRFDSLTPISEDLNDDDVLQLGEDINLNGQVDDYELLSEIISDTNTSVPNSVKDRDGNGVLENFGVVVCDPLGAPFMETFPTNNNKTFPVPHVGLKETGVMAVPGALRWDRKPGGPGVGAADLCMELITRGRDDVLFLDGVGNDDPPLNGLTGGARSFQGRMTCMLALARIDTAPYLPATVPVAPPLVAGELARLSVVVFHGRTADRSEALVAATYDASSGALVVPAAALPTGRTIKDVVRPGMVVYDGTKVHAANVPALGKFAQYERFSQTTMASVESAAPGATSHTVFVTFSGPAPSPGPVQILVDSVGLAEQTVVLEGAGAYGR